jgi:DNA-binding CsgD family transcriptional regulator
MKHSNALAHVRQLCTLGLGGAAVMPAVLRSLRQLVPCDSAAFFWVDTESHIANMYAERMLAPEAMRRYFERHYEADEHAFRARFDERVASRQWVAQIDAGTELRGTAYFEEILRPLDAHRILQGIVHEGGRPLGQVSLYRGARAARFTAAECDALAAALRYLAQAVRATGSPAGNGADYRDSDEEALVVCAADGTITAASPRALALLTHAADETLNRRTFGGAVDRAVAALLARAVRRVSEAAEPERSAAELVTANAWGRYRLRSYPLGEGRFGVLVQRQEHLLVRLADAMRALALSAQQREAALLLAQGCSNQHIAARMGVSINTASYHVKQLFAKLVAHDRVEAITRILDGHTARR